MRKKNKDSEASRLVIVIFALLMVLAVGMLLGYSMALSNQLVQPKKLAILGGEWTPEQAAEWRAENILASSVAPTILPPHGKKTAFQERYSVNSTICDSNNVCRPVLSLLPIKKLPREEDNCTEPPLPLNWSGDWCGVPNCLIPEHLDVFCNQDKPSNWTEYTEFSERVEITVKHKSFKVV